MPTADPSWLTGAAGVTGVLAFIIICFITGWMVTPGRFKDAKENEATWRSAYEREREAREKADKASEAILSQVELTIRLLHEVRAHQEGIQRPRSVRGYTEEL